MKHRLLCEWVIHISEDDENGRLATKARYSWDSHVASLIALGSHSLVQLFSFFFFFLMATPVTYGSSQTKVKSELQLRPTLEPQQCGIQAPSMTYTEACSNAGSLTHWARPGIGPATSWTRCQILNHWATMETPTFYFSWNTLLYKLKTLHFYTYLMLYTLKRHNLHLGRVIINCHSPNRIQF